MSNLEIVRSGFGHLGVYLNDLRIAGEKPWGGGMTIHTDIGDLIMREDGSTAVVVRLGDETNCPWWQSPVAGRNREHVQIRKLTPSGRLQWISRNSRVWRRVEVEP